MARGEPGNRLDIRPWEAEAKFLWETTNISAADLGRKYGVNKNIFLGVAHRRGWVRRNPDRGSPPATTFDERLDAVWAKFEAELAECERLREISRAFWKVRDDRHQRNQAAH